MIRPNNYNVAVVGATGIVGQTLIQMLVDRDFPFNKLSLFASERSIGKTITVDSAVYEIEALQSGVFADVDIAFFAAGGSVSQRFVPQAVQEGAIVVDNTSTYRLDPDIPLIVPEVNEDKLYNHNGLIANPNCSTIQMVTALHPITEVVDLNRIIASTYQAASGAGETAVSQLKTDVDQVIKKDWQNPSNRSLAFNTIPKIDAFLTNGYTGEELKMMNETKKLFNHPELPVSATCVRVPVVTSHGLSVYIEIGSQSKTVSDLTTALQKAPGIIVSDDPAADTYPTPADARGKDDVVIGRIRQDPDYFNGFHLWIVSDNLRKGAALNSIQIAESLIKNHLV